jgi:chromosome segregation protein
MRLKKLHLQGFKTFADRTEIEFSEGVTAIVGPNGSGKSNIADAILWVLGEQKPSTIPT